MVMAKKKQENKTKSKTRKPLLSGRFKFTIGFKMITIISLIIASALFGITFLATYFFKEDYELRIKENSHEVAHAIALKVRSDFNAIVSQADYLASILEDKQSGDHEKTTLKEHVFGEDSSIVFVALVSRSGDVFSTDIHASHKKFLEQNSLSDDDFFNAIKNEKSSLMNVFNGDTIVNNASLFFKIPIISIGIPYRYSAPSKASTILVIYVPMTPFLESVKSTGITKSMIVNGFGDVLAHHDSSLVRAKTNFVNLPIVAAMLKSKADNGLLRYADSDGSYYLGAYYKTGFGDTGIISTAPESKAFEALYRIRWRNILITLIVLNAGILIVYFFSKTLTRPIKRLVSATQEIEKGNFHVDIKRTSSDEVGDLTDSFVKMGIGLGERERIKDAFGKFVNKELADKVLRGELKLGGERITAPVFFSDIRYFTAISEKMDPEEVVDFLNEYMTRMVDCVNRTGGVVDKFIGDAIMAIWGTPVSSGNDTESAVNCPHDARNPEGIQRGARHREKTDNPDRVRHQYRPGHRGADRLPRADGVYRHRRHGQRGLPHRVAQQALRHGHPYLAGFVQAGRGDIQYRGDAENHDQGQEQAPADIRHPGKEGRPAGAEDDRGPQENAGNQGPYAEEFRPEPERREI